MTTSPYMPLYIADYLADTSHLTTEESGAYMLLIMAYWQRGKALPADPNRLANIARLPNERWVLVERSLNEFFEVVDGTWRHKRVEQELQNFENKVQQRKDAGKRSAEARNQRNGNDRATSVQREPNERSTNVDVSLERKPNYSESESYTESEGSLRLPKYKKNNLPTSLSVGDAARASGQLASPDLEVKGEIQPQSPDPDDPSEVKGAMQPETPAAPAAQSAPIPSGYNHKALRPPVVTDIDRDWAIAQRPAEWDEAVLPWADHVAEQVEAFEEFYAMTPKPAAEWSGMWRRVWWPKADPNIRHPEIAPQIPHPFFRKDDPVWPLVLAILTADELKVAERFGVAQFRPNDPRIEKLEAVEVMH